MVFFCLFCYNRIGDSMNNKFNINFKKLLIFSFVIFINCVVWYIVFSYMKNYSSNDKLIHIIVDYLPDITVVIGLVVLTLLVLFCIYKDKIVTFTLNKKSISIILLIILSLCLVLSSNRIINYTRFSTK